jgi:membrane protein implicated in regulation of membrane protease activity
METFIHILTSFPTAIFTFLVGLSMLFWLSSFLGLIDLDALDIDVPELDSPMVLNSGEGASFGEMLAGLFTRFGLNGVPITIVFSLVSVIGWVISYYCALIVFNIFGDGVIAFLLGVPILIFVFYLSVMMTAFLIRPLRKFFSKISQQTDKRVLGQVAVVRSTRVDNGFGEVLFDDGGAGLILKARTTSEQVFKKGERVVLLEYLAAENQYRVVSEEEFLTGEDNSN